MANPSAAEASQPGPFAHSRNAAGLRQPLPDHLLAVARLAFEHAAAFSASEIAYLAGLWHDLGKFSPEWQRYLLASEAGTQARGTGPEHKGAGSLLAAERCPPLSLLIAGHHGGLPDHAELKSKLKEWEPAARLTLSTVPERYREVPVPPALPDIRDPHQLELFLRFLFSALVDADFLDTERHLNPGRGSIRGAACGLADLWQPFAALQSGEDRVSVARREVFDACVAAAESPPGLFRLTVPTGGGKTLSGMAFALQHAIRHGLRRVIVAVPYTTITEQTADVYREALAMPNAVLEHHSAIEPAGIDDQGEAGVWARLGAMRLTMSNRFRSWALASLRTRLGRLPRVK